MFESQLRLQKSYYTPLLPQGLTFWANMPQLSILIYKTICPEGTVQHFGYYVSVVLLCALVYQTQT